MGKVIQMPTRVGYITRLAIAEALFDQALSLEDKDKGDQAIELYKKALEANPLHYQSLLNLGRAYFTSKRFAEAESCYRRSIEIKPDYAMAHFNLGCLFDEQWKHDLAISSYLEAIRFDPNYPDPHFNVALLYQGRSMFMSAIKHWRQYIKINGDVDGFARKELSIILGRMDVKKSPVVQKYVESNDVRFNID